MNLRQRRCALIAALLTAAVAAPGYAVDLFDVEPAAMDQPQINEAIFTGPAVAPGQPDTPLTGTGLTVDENGDFVDAPYFTVQAYLDTGASSILISDSQRTALGVPITSTQYTDTGVVGTDIFHVSTPLHIRLADNYPRNDLDLFDNGGVAQVGPYNNLAMSPPGTSIFAQVGPVDETLQSSDIDDIDQLISQLNAIDVVGMPGLVGSVVVINPQHVNDFFDVYNAILNGGDNLSDSDLDALLNTDISVHTHIYAPGTPFHQNTQDTDPGIPTTSYHIKLSYASFDQFTTISPAGAQGPTLAHNPFIGNDPVAVRNAQLHNLPIPAGPPGIKISRTVDLPGGGQVTNTSEGNWLLDTGAAASMISTQQAGNLGIHYLTAPTADNTNPILLDENNNPVPEQFDLTIGGIGSGGNVTIAGFYLDSLLLRTVEGSATNDNDVHNITFHHVPVLVYDVVVADPNDPAHPLILDGVFGMNMLVASASISTDPDDPLGIPTIDGFSTSNFSWVTFDEPNGILGLQLDPSVGAAVPEPASLFVLACGIPLLAKRRKK